MKKMGGDGGVDCPILQTTGCKVPCNPGSCSNSTCPLHPSLYGSGFTYATILGSCRVSPQSEFAPTSTQLAMKWLKFILIFLLPRINDNIMRMMKQNHKIHIYFSFFNPLKVTGELEKESLE